MSKRAQHKNSDSNARKRFKESDLLSDSEQLNDSEHLNDPFPSGSELLNDQSLSNQSLNNTSLNNPSLNNPSLSCPKNQITQSDRRNAYKPPSAKEIQELTGTADLFKSNLIKWQIEELLNNVAVPIERLQRETQLDNQLWLLKQCLESMDASPSRNASLICMLCLGCLVLF